MELSRKQKLIIFSAVSLVVLILFVYLVAWPLFNKVKDISQEYLDSKKNLAEVDQRESLFRELETDYQAKQDDLESIEGIFLDQKDTVGFISTLEMIAAQTGNIFEIKTAGSYIAPNEDEESFLTLRISLWGDFSSLLEFLASIENSPYPPYRLIEIDSLTIGRLGERGSSAITDLSALLKQSDLETIIGIKIYIQD